MATILGSSSRLPVKYAENGESIQAGSVYIAPPDYHLLIRDAHLGLGRGPRENRHRPAADPLFRTAAATYDSRVIGVVLTGKLDDGARGLMAIKKAGGMAVVQDPEDAQFPGMPQAALNSVAVDYKVPLSDLASLLVRLTEGELPERAGEATVSPEGTAESSVSYTCPECGGPLRDVDGGQVPYYRCKVGHAYSPESALRAQRDVVENSLWAAVVSLEQQAEMSRRLSKSAQEAGRKHSALHFQSRAENAERHAEVVRSILVGRGEDQPR